MTGRKKSVRESKRSKTKRGRERAQRKRGMKETEKIEIGEKGGRQ